MSDKRTISPHEAQMNHFAYEIQGLSFSELNEYRTILMDVWIKKEDAYISTVKEGQILETKNMHRSSIGVVTEVIGRTIYLKSREGLVYYSTADMVVQRFD